MKERPILFNGAMVRAILAGTKTQTRRVIKPQIEPWGANGFKWDGHEPGKKTGAVASNRLDMDFINTFMTLACPFGLPGDRLAVKETFYAWGRWETRYSAKKGRDEWHFVDMTIECGKQYRYPASMTGDNGPRQRGSVTPQWWKRPAIFMPRWASRITLEITNVRVERLNDVSEADARAEGIEREHGVIVGADCVGGVHREITDTRYYVPGAPDMQQRPSDDIPGFDCGCDAFAALWESVNGPGSWDANPWVWVVEFKRVE